MRAERALHFIACDSVEFFLKQDSQYVYLGIRSIDTNHTGIDLYLGDDHTARHLLHVSSAHGQKDLPDTAQAELRFGENRLWTANAVEVFYADDEQRIQAPELFEFQIDKQLIEGQVLRLFVHFKRPERMCPARAVADSTAGWLEFRL